MFTMLNPRSLKTMVFIARVLVVAVGVYAFLIPTTIEAHSDNEYPHTDHHEILESGWAICTPYYKATKVGDWWYAEACIGAYYCKSRWQSYHGKHPCGGCGAYQDSSVHWVSDADCPGNGYFSCVSSGCYQN